MNLKYIKGAVTLSEKLQTQTSHTCDISLSIMWEVWAENYNLMRQPKK